MQEVLEITKELVACRSYNQENVNKAVGKAADFLQSWGINPQIDTNKGYKMLTATLGTGKHTLILNGHLDVVLANEEQFLPKIVDGKLFGRGTYDMLAAASVMMSIMKDVAQKKPNFKIVLMLVPTEETDGTIGTEFLINNGIKGDFAICGEPTNLQVSFMSKGVLRIRITVFGKSAHSSRPWLGDNAILKALRIFNEISTLPFTHGKNKYYDGPTISLSKINGGKAINQVPDSAIMDIDIRFLPEQNAIDILEQIKSLDKEMEINIIRENQAVSTDPKNLFLEKLNGCVNDELPGTKLIVQLGSADTRFFQAAGIPSVEFGPIGGGHHGPNEYVEIESLRQYKTILGNFIRSIEVK